MAGIVAKTRSLPAGLRYLSLLAALAPAPAFAGAWIAPEGGQTISTEIAGQRDDQFYSESALYIEAPLSADLAIVASPWVTADPTGYGIDALRWEVTLGAKRALLRTPRYVMALQGSAIWYSDPAAGCAEAGAELRWLGGMALGPRSFANLEAAERASSGGCGGERAELTLGYRPAQRWLGLAQVFYDAPRPGEGSIKVQMTAVRFGDHGRGLQIGLRARVDGQAAEPALVLGFWGRGGRHGGDR